jgi:hypothetical protein
MKISKFISSAICCLLLAFLLATPSRSIQIGTKFADVVLENLQPGGVYNLTDLKKLPLAVENKSDETTEIVIDAVAPLQEELKEGYELIPDADWITIIPNRYRLAGREIGYSDIIISIPDDKNLIGKHYQITVHIQAHSVGGPQFDLGGAGLMVVASLGGRLRFSIGTGGPEALKFEKMRKKMLTLDFELMPMNVEVKGEIELGKKINLKKEKGVQFKLINKADEPLELNMISAKPRTIFRPYLPDYEYCPDTDFLTIKPKKLILKGNTIKLLKVYIRIPDKEEYYGKKYVFIIKGQLVDAIPIEIYSKVYVTTPEKEKKEIDRKKEEK